MARSHSHCMTVIGLHIKVVRHSPCRYAAPEEAEPECETRQAKNRLARWVTQLRFSYEGLQPSEGYCLAGTLGICSPVAHTLPNVTVSQVSAQYLHLG
jgi:hypothetical protein